MIVAQRILKTCFGMDEGGGVDREYMGNSLPIEGASLRVFNDHTGRMIDDCICSLLLVDPVASVNKFDRHEWTCKRWDIAGGNNGWEGLRDACNTGR